MIEQMERETAQLRQGNQKIASIERDFNQLIERGLLKTDVHGGILTVESWEEHQRLKQMQE